MTGRITQSRLVRSCTIDGCDKPRDRGGLCQMHSWRLRMHGDPLKTKQAADGEITAWLEAHTNWQDKDNCLLWPFGMSSHKTPGRGYPVAGKRKGHAVMCELAHGPAPIDKPQVAHSCDNRQCVNPHHLRWASHQDNMDDMVARNRARHGEEHARAKLTEEAVRIIRATPRGYGVTKRLCQQFGVHEQTLRAVWRGQTWRAVE